MQHGRQLFLGVASGLTRRRQCYATLRHDASTSRYQGRGHTVALLELFSQLEQHSATLPMPNLPVPALAVVTRRDQACGSRQPSLGAVHDNQQRSAERLTFEPFKIAS